MTKKKNKNKKRKQSLKEFLNKSFFLDEQQAFYDKHCNTKFLIPILNLVIILFIGLTILQTFYIFYGP